MKIFGKFLDILAAFVIIYGTPSSVLTGRNFYINWKIPSQTYQTEEEANRDLEQEKKKMKLENTVIKLKFGQSGKKFLGLRRTSGTYMEKIREGEYIIIFGDFAKNKIGLKHELYHIFETENKKIHFPMNNFDDFLAEWRAQNYLINNTF